MKTLLIMRHGKSSWKDDKLPDNERPLKKRGRKDSAHMGELLKKKDLIPDVVLCSTAKRSRQTADILLEEMDYKGEVQYLDSLYMAETEVFFNVLHALPDYACVLIIGHNPGLETLLQMMTNDINSLPTAAVAHVTLPIEHWEEFHADTSGELKNLWLPREID